MPGGFIGQRQLRDQSIFPAALSTRNRKYVLDMFDTRAAGFSGVGTGFASGVTSSNVSASPNILKTGAGHYEYWCLGALQTITTPVWDATNGYGLDIALDLTATEGVEIVFGSIFSTAGLSRGKLNFTVAGESYSATAIAGGGSPTLSFFARLKVRAADASGCNPLQFGFRKSEAVAFTGTAAYTDFAAFTVSGASGDISVTTRLNTGTAALVDTTADMADGVARTFTVYVAPNGSVRFLLDGGTPSVTKTDFVFDPGDVVFPFVRNIHGATSPGAIYLQEFEAGYVKPNAA
jgi:hypothetical protein